MKETEGCSSQQNTKGPFPAEQPFFRHGRHALRCEARARELIDVKLDGTYSGKAFAALLQDADSGRLTGKNVLFWDTYNSRAPAAEAMALDYHDLPEPFHYYFEQPLQLLDPEA